MSSEPTHNQSTTSLVDGHPYVAPGPTDSRSPCPALNILANHGWLPHDGKNLTIPQLVKVVQEVWNVSLPLALMLALYGVLKCGKGLKVDLSDLALHGVIEHDASLLRGNCAEGSKFAPIDIDPTLVAEFLADASYDATLETQVYTIADFGKIRARRNKEALPNGEKLDLQHAFIAKANPAMALMAMGGKSLTVTKDAMQKFMVEETFPDNFQRPEKIGLIAAAGIASQIGKATPSL